ncbi:hypothetical protein NQ315_009874 [Exocentrus adspersus]|uniref:Cyclin-dependent kinase 20 n=1 Tax=Exocentrus adspersus TaxID=1586481 RepID=A0AAV8WH74_9CUCU|nr:hypothetical protein NQ315_009874 [Exocentrus adspersus]
MNNYKLLGRAGEGAHGFVFKGMDLRTEKLVALKKIAINPSSGVPKNTMREICALRALKSNHIVKLIEVTSMGSSVVLVMEFLPWSLAEIIKNTSVSLTLPQIKAYTKMILSGVNYMHQNHVMHRDLKPANLLISGKGILKIADFGLARIYVNEKQRVYSHQVATRWYRAPELLYGSRSYTPSVDMWSVGCILGEMINGQPLFPGETDIEQLAIVLSTLGTPTEVTWPGLAQLPDYNKIAFTPNVGKRWSIVLPTADMVTINLISRILIYNGAKRLSAREALKHKFFFEKPLPAKLSQMPKLDDVKSEEPQWNFVDFDEVIRQLEN